MLRDKAGKDSEAARAGEKASDRSVGQESVKEREDSATWRDLLGGASRRLGGCLVTRRLRHPQISTTFETQPLIGSKESDLGFRIGIPYCAVACESGTAPRNLLHCIGRRRSAIARDRRGPQEPAEARLAGAYCPSERRGSGCLGDHGRDRQVQDLRVALAGALHARGSRRPASRQVPPAGQGADRA